MRIRFLAAALAGAVFSSSVVLSAFADPATLEVPPRLGEVRGMAWDDATQWLWLAGDEAAEGAIVGLGGGEESTRLTWSPMETAQVTGMAIHDGQLYIADLGNADGNREEFVIYRIEEPRPGRQQYRAFYVRYADGGSHDAQAFLVSGRGNMYAVTTGDDAGIYRMPAEAVAGEVNELTRVADAPTGVLDGTFLEDGATVALRTEGGVHVLDAFTWESKAVETYAAETSPEAVTVADGQLLFAGASGLRSAAAPTSDTTTTPAPMPEESVSPAPDPEVEPSSQASAETSSPTSQAQPERADQAPSNRGTIIAVSLAVLVAVLAAAATYLVEV